MLCKNRFLLVQINLSMINFFGGLIQRFISLGFMNLMPESILNLFQRLFSTALLFVLFVPAAGLFAGTIHVPREYETIQSAIETAASGDTIVVDQGVYFERLQMKKGVVVRSAGDDSFGKIGFNRAERTIIDGSKLDSDSPGVLMAEGSTLDGFTVTGVGIYNEEEWNYHYRTQGDEQSYDMIGKPGVAGISVIGISRCKVLNNIVHHIGYTGIVVMGAEEIEVRPHLVGNVAYRNMGGGIGAMMGSAPRIDSNHCYENFYAGIGHASGASATVTNNECHDNIRAGIGISEGSTPRVLGNQCFKNQRAGIGVRTGSDTIPVIEDNDCFDNQMAGIGVSEEAAAIVRDNRCYRNQLAGIGCREGATPVIERNECFENAKSGIGVETGVEATISHNHCHGNSLAGIGVRDGSEALITGNRCLENKMVAIGIDGGSDVQIYSNHLLRSGGMPPMIAVKGNSKAWIMGNQIEGGGVAAILVQGRVKITGNKIIGNGPRAGGPPNFAVWGHKDAELSMVSNRVTGWRHALFADQAKRVQAVFNKTMDFLNTAIVIKHTAERIQLVGNIAISSDQGVQCLRIEGPEVKSQHITDDNVVKAVDPNPGSLSQ